MNYVNNATLIRRELIIRLAKKYFQQQLDQTDRIPVEMFPRKETPVRCCIHKDRAVVRYRLMALMGHRIEEETDELKPLAAYAAEAQQRDGVEGPSLTVVDEACSSCVKNNYFVTNACQGCVARPCIMNCPKNAISMVDGHAKIDSKKCVNCGLCMKECPYHAIIYMPVPCEEACPVGAISKDEFGKEKIDFDKCTFCGKCLRECPFGAIMERSQIIDILKQLTSSKKTVAMIAPAIVGQFSASLGKIIGALKQLGFDEVVEVAYGADLTAQAETVEWQERMEKGEPFMTTSCCPAYTETVRKHIPELKPFVSETPSPMQLTAEWVKKETPEKTTVFVGPCVAKRNEALQTSTVDYVMSIEELGALFIASDIDVQESNEEPATKIGAENGRGFPVSGGVTAAIANSIPAGTEFKPVMIDGLDKKTLRELKRLPKACSGNFVECMACEGGCMSGPGVISNPKLARRSLQKLLTKTEKPVLA